MSRPLRNRQKLAELPRIRPLASAVVQGAGFVRLDDAKLAEARRRPGPIPEGWKPLSPTLLKASDEQTVAAVAAVLSAIAEQGGAAADAYHSWGAVAASRFLGRSQLALAVRRFNEEGVWGVSPHLIPHFALHSPSGTLSLALGLHGPNLGVGGGVGASIQGFLTAATWLDEGHLPGVWLVLSGHSPELVPGPRGEPTTNSQVEALALALVANTSGGPRRPCLALTPYHEAEAADTIDLQDLYKRIRARLTPPQPSASIYRPHITPPPASRTIVADPAMGLSLELADTEAVAEGAR